MKIQLNSDNNLNKIEKKIMSQKKEVTKIGKEKKDDVKFSSIGKDYSFAMNEIKKIPEVREGLVEELREKVKSGNYEINISKIADNIMNKL